MDKEDILNAYLRGQKDCLSTLRDAFDKATQINGANAILIDDVFAMLDHVDQSIEKEKGDE